MMSVRWIGFGACDSLTRTLIHFFPAPPSGVAPYPVHCTLSVFGEGIESASIGLDGARLNQPDGVWLDEAFPKLREGVANIVGVELEMTSNQPRSDVSGSSCIFEFISRERSVRFHPHRVAGEGEVRPDHARPLMRDSFLNTSLMIVNQSSEPYTLQLDLFPSVVERFAAPSAISHTVPAQKISEVQIPEDIFQKSDAHECSWGLSRSARFAFGRELPAGVTTALVYRDVSSKRITSVCGL